MRPNTTPLNDFAKRTELSNPHEAGRMRSAEILPPALLYRKVLDGFSHYKG